ncbi:hypothetical protein [Cellvibrio sp. pealriver]|uniref:hypothetical protein n=1 Tax=Cellvibrio sp. pealriver TaxID=1622269 RepID=UPI00066FF7A2|nr:hypothetical protein [Cellvibrio sp. pealriver]
MSISNFNDNDFDSFLRKQLQASNSYIDDDGFTAQLMASLPVSRRLNRWLELLIIAVPVTLIALLVASQFPVREVVQPIYAWILTMDAASFATMCVAAATAMLLVPVLLIFKPKPLL